MTSLKADKFLDSAGLLCSLPIVKTSLAIKEIGVGQILQVIATDPGVPPDIKAWSRQTGHDTIMALVPAGRIDDVSPQDWQTLHSPGKTCIILPKEPHPAASIITYCR